MLGVVLSAGLLVPGEVIAQGEFERESERIAGFEGAKIRSIVVEGASSSDSVLPYLRTVNGDPLRRAFIADDLTTLWTRLKIKGTVFVKPVQGAPNEVFVRFVVTEERSYDRVEYRGIDRVKAIGFVGESGSRRTTQSVAESQRLAIQRGLRREGFPHARVRIEADDETSTLIFWGDQGPKVKVNRLSFRGNESFPQWAPMNLGTTLEGSSEWKSLPGRTFPGSVYSEAVLAEDLDRLRIFYRGRGFRDAEVELAEERMSRDGTSVDLTILIVEGARYEITKVSVMHLDGKGQPSENPYYGSDLIEPLLEVEDGQFYDREAIRRDRLRIERFYAQRGHPVAGRYGSASRGDETFLSVEPDPLEVFDPEKPELEITYLIREGRPKRLRELRIRGNSDTKDHVIRRTVFIYPGDLVDGTQLDRSRQRLESLRYFSTPGQISGIDFVLESVAGDPNLVDLEIDLTEGDTGSFVWGAGISSGFGVQGRIQFTKRNFDLFRMPSSWNPVDWLTEIRDSKAFHGAGQNLELFVAPGTQITTARISIEEPDLFGTHIDRIGLRVQAFRSLRILDSFNSDRRGAIVGLTRRFDDRLSTSLSIRQETIEVDDLDANAPAIVFDAEGQTEVRGLAASMRFVDLDSFLRPTSGFDVSTSVGVYGGPFGAEADFWEASLRGEAYVNLHRDAFDRPHVLYLSQAFRYGRAYNDDQDLFLTERYYIGGNNLRGFRQRGAGPKQFDRPTGGEARYLSRLEYQFPLISTRVGTSSQENEILRGVLFNDAALLGTRIDAPDFLEPRVTVGFGIRLFVPGLGLPIALDFGWPVVFEETDERRVFYFSLSR